MAALAPLIMAPIIMVVLIIRFYFLTFTLNRVRLPQLIVTLNLLEVIYLRLRGCTLATYAGGLAIK